MRLRLLISLSCLLLLAWQRAGAQLAPADDFFHGGAQLYISNNIPQAKEVVEQGLRLYPGDDKLKKLEALLNQKQQQQQQQQQNQQQQQSQQDKSDQQKKQDQQKSQDQQKQDQQKQDEQKKEDQQKQQDQQKHSQAEKDKADQPDKKEEAQPVKPGEMTPEEAKHLLDAQKGDEQLLQLKPPEKPRNNSRPVKDW
jgi:Ca-activated chloride channel family protein